jgi:hypothetical protein
MAKLTLVQLIEMLHEEGATEEETDEAIRRYRELTQTEASKSALASVDARKVERERSAGGSREEMAADYGGETPEEARERWEQEERADPFGVYGAGAQAGGIFGEAPIVTERYDPAAVGRMANIASVQNLAAEQRRTNQLLEKLLDRGVAHGLDQLPAATAVRRLLGKRRK